ncbi:mono/diheme cytochrome c family protein [Roseimicrobium gellanilyticum]|uniref:Mono/diheme cytochrome c family protein n=1 Tax=Roseimicrobium gellanilyticum TaxID=748857 RepID=A0A366HT83_9BACT|nr:cytochrome c [Roseimicrobium gellanilyticum]RBP45907.1 mono/diheme cytochrome c family protein [Roseimicrobium gellanilyticum]
MHNTNILFIASTSILLFAPLQLQGQDPALEAQKHAGQQIYMTVCFACHQPAGQGLPGMFPPLADSDWVKSKMPDRLIRMILHGITGPITVNGKPFVTPAPLMPPQATLSDQQIADVLTYIRSSFGNSAPPVTTEQVAAIRSTEKARSTPWTEAELLRISVE